jgi:hypothetical protein
MVDRNYHYLWLYTVMFQNCLMCICVTVILFYFLGSEEETIHRFRNFNILENLLSKQAVILSNKILLFKKFK